jgi:hypothetical protein
MVRLNYLTRLHAKLTLGSQLVQTTEYALFIRFVIGHS